MRRLTVEVGPIDRAGSRDRMGRCKLSRASVRKALTAGQVQEPILYELCEAVSKWPSPP
jgi:hypothetical protein